MTTKKIKVSQKKMSVCLKPSKSLYEKDFCAWASKQKDLILLKKFNELDIEHLAEEIGELGLSTKLSLDSHIKNILLHMLKIKYQPLKKTRSWVLSIENARDEIKDILETVPSLKRQVVSSIPMAFIRARKKASKETCLPIEIFPKQCPWTQDEILEGIE